MKAMIVYESMFGNTQLVAQAAAEGLRPYGDVTLIEVGAQAQQPLPDDLDLLVVGGPTHAFGMSRPNSREDAAKQATRQLVSPGIGIREWIATLPQTANELPVATFDTKMGKPSWLPGSASRSAANSLKHHGVRNVVAHESFYVEGVTGPLTAGAPERARQWGKMLAVSVAAGRTSLR